MQHYRVLVKMSQNYTRYANEQTYLRLFTRCLKFHWHPDQLIEIRKKPVFSFETDFQSEKSKLLYTSAYMDFAVISFKCWPRHNYVHFVNNTRFLYKDLKFYISYIEILINFDKWKLSYTLSLRYEYKWRLF